ncbi:phosphate ABC transporter substrate-binding protein [Thermoleptolyngbya sp. PKUAC-SCTB121]|uniref:phosphate ABC transporter substrate-binding protein n=1 Tax=Thermoleptolyngbya sp. PKUAC-SCTB121 TaxID=2811482 RepID=UPI0019663E18|nr:phosphate ABC transporter substrate-binding protein [Thermoleptolyngbya sp. PKUAC-SCTB121]
MSQGKNDIAALLVALMVTVGLIGGGLWFFGRQFLNGNGGGNSPIATSPDAPDPASLNPASPPPAAGGATNLETSVPDPAVLTIDGSVTMVSLMKRLQLAYAQTNPGLPTTYGVPDGRPNGTNAGIQNLANGTVVLAASSRPLNAAEAQSGLVGVPIARDALAVVVGRDNPYTGGLTLDQLKRIYQGQITNWSEVGGPNAPIKVINRANDSGTQSFFKDVVLLGGDFAPEGPNFTTLPRDETTPMLRALGNNGIGYSTVQQVVNQQTVRIVPIDGVQPTDIAAVKNGTYPISRIVFLVARRQTSPAVKQFIDMALSSSGQQIVQQSGFIPLQ